MQPLASACKVTAHLTSPPPQFPLGSVTGGHNQVSGTLAHIYQNPLVPNINTHKNPKVMSTYRLVDPKDLPCTPCALQQVVPMLEPRTQQLTPCVPYGTKLTANQHSQANLQTTTYLQSYHNLRTTSRIGAHIYATGEPLCGELRTRLRRQCLPAVPCDAAHCYATTVAG